MSKPSGWPRAILHVDMDAFYVNVHLLDHPEDANLPLVVGGRPQQRGVVASASYEARAFGIRSAMPTSQAVQLCPDLKIVGVNRQRVHDCSQQIMLILGEYGPLEQVSVDEAYIDLSQQAAPVRLSDTIRQRVKLETGLPASIGLATSKLVAKVASERDKPEGRTIVLPGKEATFLALLPVRVIWGIGPRTAERLAQLGIASCGQLAQADLAVVRVAVGNHAEELQARAQGIDNRIVVPERGPARSISAERTFDQDMRAAPFLREQLQLMCAQVGESLRQEGLAAHTVVVKFRWPDFTTFTRQKTVSVGITSNADIYSLAQAIWQEHWPAGQPLRLLGVAVTKLAPPALEQMAFDF